MEYVAVVVLGFIAYAAGRQEFIKREEQNLLIRTLERYNRMCFHIIIESESESDDTEYLRAEVERMCLKEAENPNGVEVIVIAFRDADNCHDETWEEYQGRLSIRKNEIEGARHQQIRANNITAYRSVILGKKMPVTSSAFFFLMSPEGFNFLMILVIIGCMCLGWLVTESKQSRAKKKQTKKKEKEEKVLNVNGILFKEVRQPVNPTKK